MPISESQNEFNVSRRKALEKMIAGSTGIALGLPVLNKSELLGAVCPPQGTTRAADSRPYAPKFFNPHELRTISALSEAIIPSDSHSPGAAAARVHEYIDTLIAESGEDVKSSWKEGLAALDTIAECSRGTTFLECPSDQQAVMLQEISQNEEHPKTVEERLFVAIKTATINGYYTSEIGIHRELEYQGNTALAEFEGCTHEEHKGTGK